MGNLKSEDREIFDTYKFYLMIEDGEVVAEPILFRIYLYLQ